MRITAILIALTFCLSCSSTIPESVFRDNVQSSSSRTDIKPGAKLGVLPFDCDVMMVGKLISEETAKHMKSFTLVYEDEINQMKRNTGKTLSELDIDYLLNGEVLIYSPKRKKFLSGIARIVENGSNETVVRARFAPTSGSWKVQHIGEVFGTALNRELAK